ncbi:hypothetical protein ORI20_30180 [Mycobacterium sp. CVI_P3]|uniref:Uncharacterized protein n=1 Tax=Mycobacterium pinniadriaticum TaxID=2994102 RepID=A0ABT3SP65_9MYCO|nr:hypothetical protein [Mycobacterium pinniadriaticum]MCX2934540.1 hypothetical protein [Mycobacterium pinniadriaticum]MCX2940963.1 hypothetical protein [Mycobacterium pinniadriaticum]
MYKFLAGLFAGFAIIHLGFALFADMDTLRFFGRTWSLGYIWGEVVLYSALTLLFAYLGWRKKTSGAART